MPETTTDREKLVLVDAYSLLFRAFFAGRYLSTSDSRPTGALFGFTNMLFTLLNNEKPDAIVVCWDGPERTLRSQEFEAYKAHRPEVDPQLIAQMPVARDIVAAFGIQSAELPGYEADDLIGTLATRGAQAGYDVVILTGDSDQLQLVDAHVAVQITQKGVSEVKVYDAEAVRARYGIGPERIADYKALVGDTSDNIPGVPGIGEKTASALLQQYDSLENLLDHAEEVLPLKARNALMAHIEQARFSKRLATIVCDAPLDLTIAPYAPTSVHWDQVRALFAELEFRSLLARIPREVPLVEKERQAPNAVFRARTTVIESQAALESALDAVRAAGVAGIRMDLEGENPLRARVRGVAFAPTPDVAYYLPVSDADNVEVVPTSLFDEAPEPSKADAFRPPLTALRDLFESAGIKKIAYNAKPVEIVLERAGLHPTPFDFDVLIAAYLLDAGRSSYPLSDLIAAHLDVKIEIEAEDAYQEGILPLQEAAALVALAAPLRARLAELDMTRILDEVEMPLIPVLAAIEEEGLLVDDAYLTTLGARLATRIDALAEETYALAGMRFNIGSTKQLQEVLFDKLQLPTGKKTKTGYSTGADLLEQLAPQYEIARKILDYRELAKLKATYADALIRLMDPRTHRVHTSLNQTVASTGRLSSSDPNLQNIPIRSEVGREIRRAFIAPAGRLLLSCDYSQVELRLLAHITKDPTLVQAFTADEDIHVATAATVFGVPISEVTRDQRRQAKTINFAVIYGQSGFALANMLGVSTSVATQWIKEYFERLPGVKQYVEETTALAHRQKYVQTLLGRRRYVPELDSGNHQMRQAAERAAVNMPIQGTAADIMKLAMIEVHRYLKQTCGSGCTLLLQVHDELLFEVEEPMIPHITPEIVRLMSSAYPLDVPLKVDAKAGANWAEMETVKV
jgi:DNA polymerase-1